MPRPTANRRRNPAVDSSHRIHRKSRFANHCQWAASRSTISRPMFSDAVAAGEGALQTFTTRSLSRIRKSSIIEPSRPMACARTPLGAATKCSSRIAGTSRCSASHKRPLAEAAPHFSHSGAPVFRRHPQKAGIRQRVGQIAQRNISLAVTFAGKRQHGVRAALNAAVNHPREVHAQKWKTRIGHRINQIAAQMLRLGLQIKIFAAKRNNFRIDLLPAQFRHAIRMQSRARHHIFRLKFARRALHHRRCHFDAPCP